MNNKLDHSLQNDIDCNTQENPIAVLATLTVHSNASTVPTGSCGGSKHVQHAPTHTLILNDWMIFRIISICTLCCSWYFKSNLYCTRKIALKGPDSNWANDLFSSYPEKNRSIFSKWSKLVKMSTIRLHRSNTASTWETLIRIWTTCLFLDANIASCGMPSVM